MVEAEALGDGQIWDAVVSWVNDTLEGDNSSKGKSSSETTNRVYNWLEQTFDAGDKDQKGAADFVYDLFHADGGNDANTGPAKAFEMTKEEGNTAFNTLTTIAQVGGTAVLSIYGLGELAGEINEAVDATQVAANRSYLRNTKGASYVSALDLLAAFIQQYGWATLGQAISKLSSSEVRTLLKQAGAPSSVYNADFSGKLNGKLSDLYLIYPQLWSLEGAPRAGQGGGNRVAEQILSAF
jgi:hypothetical protein